MIGRNTITTIVEAPAIQYASGKSMARPQGDTSARFAPLIGFYSEFGKDDDFDAALAQLGTKKIEIKHQRAGGAQIVTHWDLGEELRIYPVTAGPVAPTVAGSLAGRNAQRTADAGIGLRWEQGERSKLAIRGLLPSLIAAGYVRLIQLSVRSHMTDALLAALIDHARVLEAADHLINRDKHPELVTYHELLLPLGPGEEQEWGKGESATVVPLISLHPDQISAAYCATAWRPERVHAAAQEAWGDIVTWAHEYAEGSEPEPGGGGDVEGGK